ncbi:MAG TPA: ATP-binding cassette domain-containing protein [Fibrobacteraceae bacterium]|jgi:cell division transport system ATP-binding protein|nr:ATP-binding cassette domain-containing protein [Fibrobacter sp.]HPW93795.1 ATP-binding cassette domain-containing protein [Fibrobacteraceae bacterium]
MIHFSHVTKTYEDNWKALSDVTCRIHKGEFVFLTGHSGAGKSTLLKMVYMDERPDHDRGGQIMVKFTQDSVYDSKTTKESSIQQLRRQMGIVFQDFKLLADRNVFENVALALRIVGTRTKDIRPMVYEALALVGISQKRLSMPYTLSGGEQQRVAIARAMVHNPYLLLADEPTGNLDPENAKEVFSIFKEINARGTTIVMATHNPDFYLNSPFRRLTLNHGTLLNRDIL